MLGIVAVKIVRNYRFNVHCLPKSDPASLNKGHLGERLFDETAVADRTFEQERSKHNMQF
jgi:hypothetical protein